MVQAESKTELKLPHTGHKSPARISPNTTDKLSNIWKPGALRDITHVLDPL